MRRHYFYTTLVLRGLINSQRGALSLDFKMVKTKALLEVYLLQKLVQSAFMKTKGHFCVTIKQKIAGQNANFVAHQPSL